MILGSLFPQPRSCRSGHPTSWARVRSTMHSGTDMICALSTNANSAIILLTALSCCYTSNKFIDLWGREEGREFRTLVRTRLYQYNPTKVKVQRNQAQAMQWEVLQGNRLDVGDGSHTQGMGASLAWDCSTAPCSVPRINNSPIPWLAGGDEKYTSAMFLSQITYFAHLGKIVGSPLKSLSAQRVF